MSWVYEQNKRNKVFLYIWDIFKNFRVEFSKSAPFLEEQ